MCTQLWLEHNKKYLELFVKSHQCVCVHENTLGVMCEGPAVEFGVGDTKVGPLHHSQVCRVATVQHVHHSHLIKDLLQHGPNGS